jgi:8-oxo-dGTP pyrophosphatase MutT (NUDIX family)
VTEEPVTTVTTVADGIARISWAQGEPIDVVRREVAAALATHARVEVLVDPEDQQAQRTATWSGMRREGIMRGVTVEGQTVDRIVYARLASDLPLAEPEGFRAILNSFLPRKRAVGQMLVRDQDDRVLMCQLTYKPDWDLPGGVIEVGESPRLGVTRELEEELGVTVPAGELLITDWLPPWSGWEDALCLVFDGGVHDQSLPEGMVLEKREIAAVAFKTLAEIRDLAADFTARRVEAALARAHGGGSPFTESGRPQP